MSDIEIIKQIENALGMTLERLDKFEWHRKNYVLDSRSRVISLSLNAIGIKHRNEIIRLISELSSLKDLSLIYNQINSIDQISSLKKLQKLSLDSNPISNLKPLSCLASLNSIWLNNCRIRDLTPLSKLQNLKQIALDENQITNLSPISDLKNLQNISLNRNQIANLRPLAELKSLKQLHLNSNQIIDLESLSGLNNLEMLSLDYNHINDLRPLSKLKRLQHLFLNSNEIINLEPISGLTALKALSLSYNKIHEIEPIRELRNLSHLGLGSNPLKALPSWIIDFSIGICWEEYRKDAIILFKNPLESPPPEIVKQGKTAVRNYFNSLEKAKTEGQELVPLKEVKVHLVGEGLAGKTSLLKRLQDIPFSWHESQTHGINVVSLKGSDIPGLQDDSDIKDCFLHFWDFGGQEIMHASHQFFMKSRSIYILVLDSRTDSRKYYWLRHIEKYGGKSPIVVVMNKIDENPAYNIQQKQINEKFPAIENRFHRLSCRNDEGLGEVVQSLKSALLSEHSMYGTPLSPDWINVKNRLVEETRNKRYISRESYEAICGEFGVDDSSSQETLLEYLDNLGIVLHFKELDFSEMYVLDPHWVTIGVYKIVNSSYTKSGKLSLDDLGYILNTEEIRGKEYDPAKDKSFTYQRDEQRFILDIMRQFELCYEKTQGRYIIPTLLPKELPDEPEFSEEHALRFVMKYDYLPATIIPRLMVSMRRDILDGYEWKYGLVLKSPDHEDITAKVVSDIEEKSLTITVQGEVRYKREYLSVIRHRIREINDSFSNIAVEEYIPLPGHVGKFEKYNELLGYEKAGKNEYFSGELGKVFFVSEMLDSVISREERQKEERMGDTIINNNISVNPEQHVTQDLKVSVNQEVHQQVQVLLGVFSNLMRDLLDVAEIEFENPKEARKLLKELEKADKAFSVLEESVTSGKKELPVSVKERLGEFFDNLADDESRINKALKLLSKGTEKAKKLVKYYNNCAPYFGLPSVPSFLLGE